MATAFIAYSHRDRDLARKIAETLRRHGIRIWIDEQNIQPGDEIASSIRAGLEASDTVILLIGKGEYGDSWARREAALALSLKDKRLVPVLASRDADVPYIVRHLNVLDLSDATALEARLDRLARHLLDSPENFRPVPSARSDTTQAASEILQAEISEYSASRAKKNIAVVAKATATAVVAAFLALAVYWLWPLFSLDPVNYVYLLVGAVFGITSARIVSSLTVYFSHRAERRAEAHREQQ